jgi:LysR family transcriptional regulator of abg operon
MLITKWNPRQKGGFRAIGATTETPLFPLFFFKDAKTMKLQQLRVLLAVAQHGSIHEASRSLHTTQPALSKTIAELERELGVTLMSRSTRGVSLTAYGVALVKRASLVEQELRHALEDIEAIRGHEEAQLNIGFTAVASSGPLPDAMASFRLRFPNVTLRGFELRPQQIFEGLREGRLDLGLVSTCNGPGTNAFQWEPLFSVAMHLSVRAGIRCGGCASCSRCWTPTGWCSTRSTTPAAPW